LRLEILRSLGLGWFTARRCIAGRSWKEGRRRRAVTFEGAVRPESQEPQGVPRLELPEAAVEEPVLTRNEQLPGFVGLSATSVQRQRRGRGGRCRQPQPCRYGRRHICDRVRQHQVHSARGRCCSAGLANAPRRAGVRAEAAMTTRARRTGRRTRQTIADTGCDGCGCIARPRRRRCYRSARTAPRATDRT
jgi:hypothetical protein